MVEVAGIFLAKSQEAAELRSVLLRNQALRNTADYERHWVTEIQAARALRRTRVFVQAVAAKGAGS